MKKELLFYENVSAKQYLSTLLASYPYDIEETMVFSLCTKNPFPHPVLLAFISYFEDIIKLRITTRKQESTSPLSILFQKMSSLSQKDQGVIHQYHFGFQAVYQISYHPFSHPYAHLPFHKIPFIDQIILHDKVLLHMSAYQELPIVKSSKFIYRDISMDASNFLAISIQITHKHGIIFLSRECASFAIALASMFHVSTPCVQQDFLLIFGLADSQNRMEYFVDKTNALYIGLVKGNPSLHHFLHLKNMILTLYNALCLHQHDLPAHASMLYFLYEKQYYGFLFAGESQTGKSELLDAFVKLCQKKKFSYQAIYDDHGTLHYLDNEIVTTAIELSACKELYVQPYQDIFNAYHDGIFLKDEQGTLYQITPMITFEETMKFHNITHIFYLDNTQKFQSLRLMDTLEEGLHVLQKGEHLDQACKLQQHFFFNACGCVQEQDGIRDFVIDFITHFYVSGIPLYHVATKAKDNQKRILYTRIARCIFEQLLVK